MTKIKALVLLAAVTSTSLAKASTYQVLHNMGGSPTGTRPEGELLRDKAGNLYGTTYYGGDENYGVVFKLDAKGKYSVGWCSCWTPTTNIRFCITSQVRMGRGR
jgi:uncharacterized repeat protein (TIGR03803 family)